MSDALPAHKLLPVVPAWSLIQRVRGLLGRQPPAPGSGLLIFGCKSIHTFGMAFPIDVLFIDASHRILRIFPHLPAKKGASCKGAAFAVELAAGEADRLGFCVDDSLVLCLSATDSLKDGRKRKD